MSQTQQEAIEFRIHQNQGPPAVQPLRGCLPGPRGPAHTQPSTALRDSACLVWGATAPLTAIPAEASGTFNPLHGVLCILRSLYLCSIGPRSVLLLAMDTHRTSNCSPKPLYSWMWTATPQVDPSTRVPPYRTVSSSCGPFQDSPWCWDHPGHSRPLRCPQHLLWNPGKPIPRRRRGGRGFCGIPFRKSRDSASSLAVTAAIAVACASSTE